MTASVTIDTLLASVRANLAAKLTQREAETKKINEVREACHKDGGREPTDAESEVSRAAVEARIAIDAEVQQFKARIAEFEAEKRADEAAAALSRDVQATQTRKPAYDEVINRGNTTEERTYNPESSARGVSWLSDAWHNNQRSGGSERFERLQRHAREVEVEGQLTQRAVATGSFAGLVPPQYLVDMAAAVLRAGRPFANSVGTHLQLPDTGMTFQIPRGTTGASAATQATENSSVSSTDEVWANLTLNVATAAGQQDVSRQTLDRGYPGTDALVFKDLAGAYAVSLDQGCISGSGSSGQVLGILNTSGVTQAAAYTAAATAQSYYSKVGGAASAIEDTRFLVPDTILMAPRRWAWLRVQFDSAGRPLVVPTTQGPFNALANADATATDITSVKPRGEFQDLAVITDANVPKTVGSASEDVSVVYCRHDLILWEDGDGTPQELRFEQTLANQLTVKLVVAGYYAFTAGRYPQSVAITGGNSGAGFGQVLPVF